MSGHGLAGLGLAAAGGFVLGVIGPLPAVAFVVQCASAFGLLGTFVAHRARRRHFRVDPWVLVARWTLLGAMFGMFVEAVALSVELVA